MNSYRLADLDPSIVIEPKEEAQAVVIWLHGLGADGNDFAGIIPQLDLPDDHAIRFIFPHAPQQPVTVNGGMVMRSWYDIYAMDIAEKMDLESIELSSQVVNALIEKQLRLGIAAEKIVIAGFSQGGLVVLNVALKSQLPLAGVMALSTYYPSACFEMISKVNKQVPIMMVHGVYDPVIPFHVAEKSYQRLLDAGCSIEWYSYPMEHQVCMQEIDDISIWLRKTLLL